MKNLIAVCALVTLAFAVAAAQEAPKPDQITLRGVTKIKLSKLIELAKADTGFTITIDAKWDAEVEIVAPRAGAVKGGDSLMMLVQEALDCQRLVLAPHGQGYTVVVASEVHRFAPHIDEAGLTTLKPWQWANLVIALKSNSARQLTGAVRNFVTRSGGLVQPQGDDKLVICERGDRLARLHMLVQRMDKERAPEPVTLPVPRHVNVSDAIVVLSNLFGGQPGIHLRIEADEQRHSILVRANPRLRQEVADALAAME